jgi:hypothetical protein
MGSTLSLSPEITSVGTLIYPTARVMSSRLVRRGQAVLAAGEARTASETSSSASSRLIGLKVRTCLRAAAEDLRFGQMATKTANSSVIRYIHALDLLQ